jgi:predicted amidophosphoribosyltransferase
MGEQLDLNPRPAGFPDCHRCPYRTAGRPEVCLACVLDGQQTSASSTLCSVCEQALEDDGRCDNDWCTREDRWFSLVWSIASHVGTMRRAVTRYKFRDELSWAGVFARLLVGYLDEHMPWFDEYDLLVPTPAYLGPGARRGWDHVGLIAVEAARLAGARWPIEMAVIEKTAETPAMTGQPLAIRRTCAEGPLRRALRVAGPSSVVGAKVLVIDDVFTEGSTLREVARALLLAGAVEVAGVALVRQPWAGRAEKRRSRRPPFRFE